MKEEEEGKKGREKEGRDKGKEEQTVIGQLTVQLCTGHCAKCLIGI